jgi:hypothetical protein
MTKASLTARFSGGVRREVERAGPWMCHLVADLTRMMALLLPVP